MTISVEIASVLDRENLIVELWRDNYLLAEVSMCSIRKECVVEIYSSKEDGRITVDLDIFISALNKAKIILTDINDGSIR
ncbi:hypothetical protein ACM9XD_06210 [Xanthomonas sacchari]|uniref:hypothetical protein n=1 Tax=Xanthomonas TaxID=338 RepID=UPI0011E7F548|nr:MULTISPECIES: hypothetical protein [Xanthomonas]MDQ7760261.1 hypothetical protein [Xanthomonas sontii]UYK72711.1 hypothetical protein NG828_21440 [Xanthomonas sacchari]UZK08968.1 hypothetical protein CJ027_020905 [Xanthomonas sontii]